MKSWERRLLNRLMVVCNDLGGAVDRTAVSEQKLYERQQALMKISNVIYGILAQNPNNPFKEKDYNKALEDIMELESLVDKVYPDRNGYLRPEEKS